MPVTTTITTLKDLTVGLSPGEIDAMANKLETLADAKAAAAAKQAAATKAAAKAAAAKHAAVAKAATTAKGAAVTGKTATAANQAVGNSVAVVAKTGAGSAASGTIWTGKGLSLGLGLGLGALGPVILVAGVGAVGYAAYRYYQNRQDTGLLDGDGLDAAILDSAHPETFDSVAPA